MLSASSAAVALRAGSALPTPDACGLTLSPISKTLRVGDHLEMHPGLDLIEPSYGEHEMAATPSCSSTSSRESFGGHQAVVARRSLTRCAIPNPRAAVPSASQRA